MSLEDQPPRWRIADDLRAAIRQGELQAGDALPSGRELAQKYQTARNTADEALRILEGEGLITIRQGARAVVRQRRPLMRLGANRYSRRLRDESGMSPFLLEAARQGWHAHVEARTVERVQPPEDVAARLNVPATSKSTLRRENWYYADNKPVQIGITYLPWQIAKGTPLTKPGEPIPTGIYAYLETLGYTMAHIREEVTARTPTPEQTRDLQLPPGVPIIEVLHTSISATNIPYDVTRFTIRADMMGLDYTIPTND
jgi:GntR family transcriptional regulator